jgi:hypothetical protein
VSAPYVHASDAKPFGRIGNVYRFETDAEGFVTKAICVNNADPNAVEGYTVVHPPTEAERAGFAEAGKRYAAMPSPYPVQEPIPGANQA